jgi:hypothetical protein
MPFNRIFFLFFLLLFLSWQTLALEPGASLADIKAAFRREALRWHPDKNDGDDAQAQFVAVGLAYQLLSDDSRRALCERSTAGGESAFRVDIDIETVIRLLQVSKPSFSLCRSLRGPGRISYPRLFLSFLFREDFGRRD